MMIALTVTVLIVNLHKAPDGATPSAPTTQQTEWLAATCRYWGAIRAVHPALTYQDIDWDAALLAAVPKLLVAADEAGFERIIREMHGVLREPDYPFERLTPHTPGPAVSWPAAGLLLIRTRTLDSAVADKSVTADSLKAAIHGARRIVVDARGTPPWQGAHDVWEAARADLGWREVTAPAIRRIQHDGFVPQVGTTSGGYSSALLLEPGGTLRPTAGLKRRRVVFVVDDSDSAPEEALALQQSGDAFIVAHRGIWQPGPYPASVRLTDNLHGVVRSGEPVSPLVADVVVADGEDPLRAALKLARADSPRGPKRGRPLPDMRVRQEKEYPLASLTTAHYYLGLCSAWNTFELFYPYEESLGDWSATLRELGARMVMARGFEDYYRVLLELGHRTNDGHTNVFVSPGFVWPMKRPHGDALVLHVELRVIEGEPVVTRQWNTEAGFRVGDVIVSVDGEPAKARLAQLGRLISASNEGFRGYSASSSLLSGDVGRARIEVRGVDGKLRTLTPTRVKQWTPPPAVSTERPPYRMLAGNIGYVDLREIRPDQVDAMFTALMSARAIVFDMRGYPQGTFYLIGPRLNVKRATVAALFRRRVVDGHNLGEAVEVEFKQRIPPTDQPIYSGKTVMLIDERAMSQSEHTGLWFEATSGITFVGSPTSGANGDVTTMVLPGGLRMMFSGHEVKHADGRPLQRVGLQPHIRVTPTLTGVRAGRDEVLERALKFIETGK